MLMIWQSGNGKKPTVSHSWGVRQTPKTQSNWMLCLMILGGWLWKAINWITVNPHYLTVLFWTIGFSLADLSVITFFTIYALAGQKHVWKISITNYFKVLFTPLAVSLSFAILLASVLTWIIFGPLWFDDGKSHGTEWWFHWNLEV